MEEDKFYKMYQKELEGIAPCEEEELLELAAALKNKEDSARRRLIEGNLERVVRMAQKYENKGLSFNDLVQEGNVALTMAVYEYEDGSILPFLEEKIAKAMEEALKQQQSSDFVAEKVTAYINVMNEVTSRLTEELGRQATVEEVAEKMQLSVDEVKGLMKTALNAVSF